MPKVLQGVGKGRGTGAHIAEADDQNLAVVPQARNQTATGLCHVSELFV